MLMFSRRHRATRQLFSLPVRGQRTRSNAKTAKKNKLPDFRLAEKIRRLERSCPGVIFGSRAKAKKIRAKLKPKGLKLSKKKGPVVRSRDKKKSV